MSHFRKTKQELRLWLASELWQTYLPEITALGLRGVGALLALLPVGGELSWRAAHALGALMAQLAEQNLEESRNIFRRLMWHMNEESGNIAWGIPEAMGEIVGQSRTLALLYHKIVISYIRQGAGDGNLCDHAPLRRSCYWAIARLARAWPDLAKVAFEPLLAGLHDSDRICRFMALYALAFSPFSKEDKKRLDVALVPFRDTSESLVVWEERLLTLKVAELAARVLRTDDSTVELTGNKEDSHV